MILIEEEESISPSSSSSPIISGEESVVNINSQVSDNQTVTSSCIACTTALLRSMMYVSAIYVLNAVCGIVFVIFIITTISVRYLGRGPCYSPDGRTTADCHSYNPVRFYSSPSTGGGSSTYYWHHGAPAIGVRISFFKHQEPSSRGKCKRQVHSISASYSSSRYFSCVPFSL